MPETVSKKIPLPTELDRQIRLAAAAERTNGNEFCRRAIAARISHLADSDAALRMILERNTSE
jgi:hypothetical protein